MPFDIVEGEGRTFWVATDGASTYYKGQIVSLVYAGKNVSVGVVPLAVPAGAADATNYQIPIGVVVGFNRRTPQYTTVGNMSLEYEAGVLTQELQVARDWTGAEGMYTKGDPQPLIQIAEITPNTVLRGPFCNVTLGAVPTVVTATAAGTDGWTTAGTTGACSFTPVARICSVYCRSGANMGLYRVTNDVSTTAPDVTIAFPYDIGIGDTFVRVPAKQGLSQIYIAGPGLWIDCTTFAANTSFHVFVYKLDLRDAGKETCDFRFATTHFDMARA